MTALIYTAEVEYLTCNEVALLAEVKIDDVDNVADFAHATEGLAGEEGVHLLLRHAADQIGLDGGGTDRVDCDL